MKLKHRIARYLGVVLPCTLILAAAPANAELYQFSYTFKDGSSRLSGFLEGTPDANNADRVFITSFGAVRYTTGGFVHDYPSIAVGNFNTYPADGRTPVVTYSGTEIAVRACPNGFNKDDGVSIPGFNDCIFKTDGGFFIETGLDTLALWGFDLGVGVATATVGEYAGYPCEDCRVWDFFGTSSNWQLTLVNAAVDPTVDLDPTVTLGDNTTLDKNITVEENVIVGDNVTVEKDVSIGADSEVGENSMLDKGTSTGSNVTIGENVTIEWNVVIQDGVSIGDGAYIYRGAVLCSGVSIGAGAVIGKNAVVDDDVPDTGAIPNDHPGSCTP